MAYESPNPFTWSAIATTGIKQYVACTVNSSGKITVATGADRFAGVLISSGTTGSTRETPQTLSLLGPVLKMRCSTASTGIAAGDFVALHTGGLVTPSSAGDYNFGPVLQGVASTLSIVSLVGVPWGTT